MPRLTQATFINKYKSNDLFWIVCILAVSILVIIPIPLWGIPDNYDLMQHMRFAKTFYEALQTGSITPSWAASDNMGYGSVGVRIYPPFVYVLLSIIQTLTHSWYDTLWISIFFWMFVGCVGVYYLAKEWLSQPQAAFTAVLYAVVPYHLAQIYQAFFLAEFTASAILPFCFLFAYKIVKRGKWLDTLLFSLFFTALLLSHIPSSIIGPLALGFFFLFIFQRETQFRAVTRFLAAFGISLAATSYFWIRLITEANWVSVNSTQFYAAGNYNYATYLFPLYFNGITKYIERFFWFNDIETILTLLMFVPFLIAVILRVGKNDNKKRAIIAFAATGLFAFFMLSWGSKFLWDNIVLLQKLQFPWRWLSIASLMGVMVLCLSGFQLLDKFKHSRLLGYSFGAILLVIGLFDATQVIIPSAPIPRAEFDEKMEDLDSKTGCECFWPMWAKNAAVVEREKVTSTDRTVNIGEWTETSRSFKVSAGQPSSAQVATFYYPYWQARVNGAVVDIGIDAQGTMLIPLGREESAVDLIFREPAQIAVTKAISLAVWIILLGSILVLFFRRKAVNDANFVKLL